MVLATHLKNMELAVIFCVKNEERLKNECLLRGKESGD